MLNYGSVSDLWLCNRMVGRTSPLTARGFSPWRRGKGHHSGSGWAGQHKKQQLWKQQLNWSYLMLQDNLHKCVTNSWRANERMRNQKFRSKRGKKRGRKLGPHDSILSKNKYRNPSCLGSKLGTAVFSLWETQNSRSQTHFENNEE